jgi:hypothetical protein
MKSLFALFLVAAAALSASASEIKDLLGPAAAGRGTVYFRVALEKRNGIDMREYVMLKDLIQALEKQGASVRPERNDANVSYWIFFKNGDFATCDVLNEPAKTHQSYAQLQEYFSDAPHNGGKWALSGEDLVIGQRVYSVRTLPADDPKTGGKQGEVEIAVLYGQDKMYYYFGSIIKE